MEGYKPGATLRVKLPANPHRAHPNPSAFFNAAVVAATAGNFDAALKALRSGDAALENMTEDDPLFNTRKWWRWAARARYAREKRWIRWQNKQTRAWHKIRRLRAMVGYPPLTKMPQRSSDEQAVINAKRAAIREANKAKVAAAAVAEERAAAEQERRRQRRGQMKVRFE